MYLVGLEGFAWEIHAEGALPGTAGWKNGSNSHTCGVYLTETR